MIFILCILVIFALFLAIAFPDYIRSIPLYLEQRSRQPFHGRGKVLYLTEDCKIPNPEFCEKRIYSGVLGEYRDMIVYLPETYEDFQEPLPLIIALHGNHSDENAFGRILPAILDDAIGNKIIPPLVMVAPDFSVGMSSANILDVPLHPKTGSFYINSNLGRYRDYFYRELVPWLRSNFNISTDPRKVILLGQSMGGFGAFYLGFQHPEISKILVGIFPAVDLRYSCHGNHLADYALRCYQPISSDDPKRLRMVAFAGLFKQTEEELLYPVFKDDFGQINAWRHDMPVWERIRSVNPVDILRDNPTLDLSGTSMFMIAGSEDEYNIDSQVLSFIQVATSLGYNVAPEKPIVPRGRHTPYFLVSNMEQIIIWINQQLLK